MGFGRGRVDPVRRSLNAPPGMFVHPLRVKITLPLRLTAVVVEMVEEVAPEKIPAHLITAQPSSRFCQICQGKAARLAPCRHANIWLWCGEPEANQARPPPDSCRGDAGTASLGPNLELRIWLC